MANAIAHRGPDAKGHWVSADGRVVLAHRRLAVIDLDERARQPMIGSDGRTVIAYNGEIYNHADLRRQLRSAGHAFRTASSDTEVLLEGYRAWGLDGLLSRVDGIFAFALHDGAADVTHLVRDRYGIKPLYVAWRDDGHGGAEILFASEVRAITAHPKVRARIDWRQVARYLTFLSVPAPATMLQGIWKVPAGCRVAVTDDGRATIARFHEAADASVRSAQPRPRDAIVADLRATFARVVDSQLVADVPVSVMLSGGLDSGAILAQASRRHRGLDAFTVAFVDDPDGDETALAAETARHCGARHHVLRLTSDDATDRIDDVIVAMDEPQADWVCVPLWFLAREVAARGTKVILVGEGALASILGSDRTLGEDCRCVRSAGSRCRQGVGGCFPVPGPMAHARGLPLSRGATRGAFLGRSRSVLADRAERAVDCAFIGCSGGRATALDRR
jgi:asparagine synthase (glutamine-hydrolysing)